MMVSFERLRGYRYALKAGAMRIEAGEYKGRTLLGPPKGGPTRPITGRARKSLLAVLGEKLEGALAADLYCGTGTLGIEAISRGARRCCFAERDRRALGRLRRNIRDLGIAGKAVVWPGDVLGALAARLAGLGQPLDLVFVDPPYAQTRRRRWLDLEARLFAPLAEHLADGGVVVLRLPGDVQPPEALGGLAIERVKRYGDMLVALYGPQAKG